MKTLAEQNPGLVRLITLPNKTWLGRDVLGLEIATDVNVNDGRPAFLNLGVHHAREWPSGEHAMEWALRAHQRLQGRRRARLADRPREPQPRRPDRQPRRLQRVAHRGHRRAPTAAATRRSPTPSTSSRAPAPAASTGARTAASGTQEAGNCATSAGLAENGTDPNRNYGGLWGGPGAEHRSGDPDLPRPRPVLRARDEEHPVGSSRATRS